MNCRKYRDDEEIRVGDVVDANFGAFACCIVSKIENTKDDRLIHLSRPMMKVDTTGGEWIYVEHFAAFEKSFRKNYSVYTRGVSGEVDNRT